MTGYILAIVFFALFLYWHGKARFWKTKLKENYRSALKDQRKLKSQIDKLRLEAK
jgi:hypothetical protein